MTTTPTKGKRAVLYLRASKNDQHPENQRPSLERIASARGLDVVAVFEEKMSAVKRRPAFEAMQKLARRRGFDCLIFWAIDRFGRSLFQNMADIVELDGLGIRIISHEESWLDTAPGPLRDLLIAVFSWAAQQERARLIARTKEGLARARAEGTRLGRPVRRFDLPRAKALLAAGGSIRSVAKQVKVSRATLSRELARTGGGSKSAPSGPENPCAKGQPDRAGTTG